MQASPFSPQIKRNIAPTGNLRKKVRAQLARTSSVGRFESTFNPKKTPTPIDPVKLAPATA